MAGKHHVDKLRQIFDSLDADGSGNVSASELAQTLTAAGFTVNDVQRLIKTIDLDGDRVVSWAEFSQAFTDANVDNLAELLRSWQHLGATVSVGSDMGGCAHPPAGMPLYRFALAGATGTTVSRLLTAPLEKATLMMQVSGRSGMLGVCNAMKQVVKAEGVVSLWAGAGTNSLRVAIFGSAVCIGYSTTLKLTPADNEFDELEPVWRGLSGAAAGLLATIVTHPLDVIRTRLTLQSEAGGGVSFHYNGALDAANTIVRTEGARVLWRGLMPACLSVVPFVALQQSVYDVTKERCGLISEPSAPLFLGCGAFAGVVAQTLVFPLDVVRRRMQVDRSLTGTFESKHSGVLSALRSVLQSGGPRALWAGITPSWLRVAPAVATTLVVRDTVLGRL